MFPIFQSAPWCTFPVQCNPLQATYQAQSYLNAYFVESGGIPLSTVGIFQVQEPQPCAQNTFLGLTQANEVVTPPKKATPAVSNLPSTEKCGQSRQKARTRREVGRQKFGRNVVSNIFHMLIKNLRKSPLLQRMVSKVIRARGLSLTEETFTRLLVKKAEKAKGYVGTQDMLRFWVGSGDGEQEREFGVIFRVLGRNYLHAHHLPNLHHSAKIRADSRKCHHSAVRRMAQFYTLN